MRKTFASSALIVGALLSTCAIAHPNLQATRLTESINLHSRTVDARVYDNGPIKQPQVDARVNDNGPIKQPQIDARVYDNGPIKRPMVTSSVRY